MKRGHEHLVGRMFRAARAANLARHAAKGPFALATHLFRKGLIWRTLRALGLDLKRWA